MKEHCACQLPIVAPSRRAFLAALAFTAVSPTVALTQTGGSGAAADVRFMRMALEEARQADFPFGAVIVREGSVIARGRNFCRDFVTRFRRFFNFVGNVADLFLR